MPIAKAPRTLVAAATSNAAAGTTRAAIDLEAGYGGPLSMKISNGATGPTVACKGRVLIAHSVALPAVGAAGADWKTHYEFDGGVTANAITESPTINIPPGVMALEVEFTGNTGQPVTVEASMSEITAY